ncbi:hypothetical protein EZY14_006165 [Kordia sp. TARA_039_SRF]|nr:hypothetical protein EZY14_006165 [Kordia sp. TARA_039_SRF]
MNKRKEVDVPAMNILVTLFALFMVAQKRYFKYYKTTAVFWLVGVVVCIMFLVDEDLIFLIILVLAFLGFLELTDNQLWKYPPFLWLYEVKDFSGTYCGTIEYLYFKEFKENLYKQKIFKEYKKHLQLTLIIYQTGSEINISFFYKDTVNKKSSKVESTKVVMSKTDDGQHFILTCYHGSLGILEEGGHHETIVLKFLKSGDDCFIEGGFYDNRKLQGRGKFVNLKKVNQETIHPF